MELLRFVKARDWPALFGYALFVGMMATGYYYNITFVQLGLVDLGERLVGLSRQQVAADMAWLALITCGVALGFGLLMQKQRWGQQLRTKLRLAFGVVLAQTILTAIAPQVRTESGLLAWIVFCSVALGVGVPVTFSMTVDFIPVRDRGYASALITAGAYFFAEAFSSQWTVEQFSGQILPLMAVGTASIGVLAFARLPFMDRLAAQHTRPAFGRGRYVRTDAQGRVQVHRRFIVLIVLMFGVYFVDSLGFLRLIDTPLYFNTAWHSPESSVRLFIAAIHVLAALIAGVLYAALEERQLFLWIFGIFALTHLMYAFHNRNTLGESAPLAMPALYATAVSLYTVLNFAIWADISTPRTISFNAALGVALSGWTATFLSTALALQWQATGISLDQHLRIVDSLAILFFLLMLALSLFPEAAVRARRINSPEGESR